MIRAAGILFIDPKGVALFVKRGAGGDHPGEWCVPGGRIEEGETAEEAARREAREETGFDYTGELVLWTRRVAVDGQTLVLGPPVPSEALSPPPPDGAPVEPGSGVEVDFTTFLARVPEQFTVETGDESTAYSWAKVSTPPTPLHPGVPISLARFGMDELAVAKAIASGDLASPQKYQNVWLFALRITGTGTAYREGINEYVYRRPENYLTPEFLERAAGLTVVWEHPKEKPTLDSKEFEKRVVGNIVVPHIRGDEVWGIGKIYDEEAARLMEAEQMSTSPGVVFRKADNTSVTLQDGSTLLVEGKPILLDHLAICELGVWDKGGPAAGVLSATANEEPLMADIDDTKKDAARKDADDKDAKLDAKKDGDDEPSKLEKILDALGGIGSRLDAMQSAQDAATARMDAFEKKDSKKDADDDDNKAKELAADAKKDADEKEEEAKKDAAITARVDAAVAERLAAIGAQVADVASKLPAALDDAAYDALVRAQARCDDIAVAFGDRAPRPLQGETPLGYRRRVLGPYQSHSADWKEINLAVLDESAFGIAENAIYKDALAAAAVGGADGSGSLRMVVKADESGRQIRTFHGRPGSWMKDFKQPVRHVERINTRKDH